MNPAKHTLLLTDELVSRLHQALDRRTELVGHHNHLLRQRDTLRAERVELLRLVALFNTVANARLALARRRLSRI